jgi:hypothetical protein
MPPASFHEFAAVVKDPTFAHCWQRVAAERAILTIWGWPFDLSAFAIVVI